VDLTFSEADEQFRTEFRAREVTVRELGEYAELDGGEQDFGRPKGKCSLQNSRWIRR